MNHTHLSSKVGENTSTCISLIFYLFIMVFIDEKKELRITVHTKNSLET